MTVDEHTELRDMLQALKGDMREGFAAMSGRIDTLAATKTGEHRDLGQQVLDVRRDHDSTKLAMRTISDKVERYPDPDRLQDTLDQIVTTVDGLATHAEVQELASRLEKYPKADDVEAAVARTHTNQLSIVKLAMVAAGGGIVSQLIEASGIL